MTNIDVHNPLKGKTCRSWLFEQNVYSDDGLTRALKSTSGSGNVPKVIVVGHVSPTRKVHQQDFVQHSKGICRTIPAGTHASTPHLLKTLVTNNKNKIMEKKEKRPLVLPKELEGVDFRIRKLTPRECFRLMDVDDDRIDQIQATGISKSSQYRLAGNSIVVNVLYHLMRKAFIETESEKQQLSLF